MPNISKPRSPVAQHNNDFNKPKTFRDRKTHAKNSGDYGDKPKHQPYKREHQHYVEIEEFTPEDGDWIVGDMVDDD